MMTPVDRIHKEFKDSLNVLDSAKEISLSLSMGSTATKVTLLAAASYFEYILANNVRELYDRACGGNDIINSFVGNKAISRQYHTWFDWTSNNANAFFGLFGRKFRSEMEEITLSDSQLRQAIRDFIEIGRQRNLLVHGDYATFQIEMTVDEVYNKFISACYFIETFRKHLHSKVGG